MAIDISIVVPAARQRHSSEMPGRGPSMLSKIIGGLRESFALYRAESELYGCSDLELRDMGINRTEVPYAVRGMKPRKAS
jgi:uncharacterized protein YjiS (DUF1127 family)